MIGRNKRGRVSLFGYHLTIQEFGRGDEAFKYVPCGRKNKSCVVYNRGERLVKYVSIEQNGNKMASERQNEFEQAENRHLMNEHLRLLTRLCLMVA